MKFLIMNSKAYLIKPMMVFQSYHQNMKKMKRLTMFLMEKIVNMVLDEMDIKNYDDTEKQQKRDDMTDTRTKKFSQKI